MKTIFRTGVRVTLVAAFFAACSRAPAQTSAANSARGAALVGPPAVTCNKDVTPGDGGATRNAAVAAATCT